MGLSIYKEKIEKNNDTCSIDYIERNDLSYNQ